MSPLAVAPDDAFLVVDVQNDFCSGGRLAVPGGEAVTPLINGVSGRFRIVVATQDWHPPAHRSFASAHGGRRAYETITLPYGEQILWPDHCVQGTAGAALHPDLDLTPASLILRKGADPDIDSYSVFFENDRATTTGLGGYLQARGVRRVVLAGLAFDFCVLWSAEDARRLGFDVVVLEDACRALDVGGSADQAHRRMAAAGVRLAQTSDLMFPGRSHR